MAPTIVSARRGLRFELRKAALRVALGTRTATILPDNIALFPELGIVFNRVKKSGNTSVFLFLRDLAGLAPIDADEVEAEKYRRSICTARFSDIFRIRQYRSLVCVRDPQARLLSGFLDKIGRAGGRKYTRYAGFGDPTPAGFDAFTAQLAQSDWKDIDRHFWPQTLLMYQQPRHFDCIARLESLPQDLDRFLRESGIGGGTAASMNRPHPVELAQRGKITNAALRSDLVSPESRRRIEMLYARDFEALGY